MKRPQVSRGAFQLNSKPRKRSRWTRQPRFRDREGPGSNPGAPDPIFSTEAPLYSFQQTRHLKMCRQPIGSRKLAGRDLNFGPVHDGAWGDEHWTSLPPAAFLACSGADSIPSVTKWNVV